MNGIIRIKYADSWIPESWVFEGGDEVKMVPIVLSVFLIKKRREKHLSGCRLRDYAGTSNGKF